MSASLVQRLRESVTQCRALDRSALLEEAAAEIERLRDQPVTEPMTKAKRAEVSAEPVAWAVMVGGQRMYVSWCKEMCEDEAYYHRHPCGDSVLVVPLYRQPQDGVVRLPSLDPNGAPGWNAAIGAVREALADAGVDWDTE